MNSNESRKERRKEVLRHPHIALLTNDDNQATYLRNLLQEHAELWRAGSIRELAEELETRDFDALLCNWMFGDGDWKSVLQLIQAHNSDVPVIVLSGAADAREWIEVIGAGGFDLLAPPYWKGSMLAALEHATASHEARKWHQRTLLPQVG